MPMRRLTEFQLISRILALERIYRQYHPVPPDEILAPYHWPARLEFPLGELTNPRIAGFLWAWHLQGRLNTASIAASDRFNAHGLEGKCVVPTQLSTALLAARELPPYRRAVYVPHLRGVVPQFSPKEF
jgi:hypothetical protein